MSSLGSKGEQNKRARASERYMPDILPNGAAAFMTTGAGVNGTRALVKTGRDTKPAHLCSFYAHRWTGCCAVCVRATGTHASALYARVLGVCACSVADHLFHLGARSGRASKRMAGVALAFTRPLYRHNEQVARNRSPQPASSARRTGVSEMIMHINIGRPCTLANVVRTAG